MNCNANNPECYARAHDPKCCTCGHPMPIQPGIEIAWLRAQLAARDAVIKAQHQAVCDFMFEFGVSSSHDRQKRAVNKLADAIAALEVKP